MDVTVPPVCPDLVNLGRMLGLALSKLQQKCHLGSCQDILLIKGTRGTNREVICENRAWRDGTLRSHCGPIHLILANLIEAVPMDAGRLVAQVICHLHNETVPLTYIDCWRRPLVVHSNHSTSKTVRGDPFPPQIPLQRYCLRGARACVSESRGAETQKREKGPHIDCGGQRKGQA
jgi:hypothetical protein